MKLSFLCFAALVVSIVSKCNHSTYKCRQRRAAITETTRGSIEGRYVSAPQGGWVEEYLGIPFAKPPIGDLRYADPEPYGNFTNGIYKALDMKNTCQQHMRKTSSPGFEGMDMWRAQNPLSEDCLFLNIWVPKPRSWKRAVMIWIYGGGFVSGSDSLWLYDGKTLATHGDVIVASFNYRVGTFGFLSTGDGRIKGNFGLKDQVMALRWIKENIEAFGGDPNQMTIFGESAGAASVGYHMISPQSQDLFQRAILQSGAPHAHWAFVTQKQAQERSKSFFEAVKCPDDENLLKCLRGLSVDEIVNNDRVDSNFMVFPWAPSVDGEFLSETPYQLLKEGNFKQKEALLGVNKNEGTFWILFSVDGLSIDGESKLSYEQFLKGVDVVDWDLDNDTRNEVVAKYAPDKSADGAALTDALEKVTGDRSFTCPTIDMTDTLDQNGVKTFFYYLSHRASNEVWPTWMGVIHGSDIQWVFGMPLNQSRGYTEEEVAFAKAVMDYWVNFAKTGNPNGNKLTYWPQYDLAGKQYLELGGADQFRVGQKHRGDHCQLWERIAKEQFEAR